MGVMKTYRIPPDLAKELINDLIDASYTGLLAQQLAQGLDVDQVFTQLPGRPADELMALEESEARYDVALRKVFKTMTGKEIIGDPVDFICGD